MTKTPAVQSSKKLLIVDNHALFHRSRNALLRTMKEGMKLPDGTPTTGAFGFSNNLLSALKNTGATHCLVVYDAGGNFRKQKSEDYKANRSKNSEDFYREMKILQDEVLPSFGIKSIGIKGVEADDVIFTVSHMMADKFDEVLILTCDQDILQCVKDKVKVMLFNSAKNTKVMGIEEVEEKLGVVPEHIPMLKALSGDSSDNIRGIRGIGNKTAVKILKESDFKWEWVLQHDKVRPNADIAEENLELTKSVFVSSVFTLRPEELGLGSGTYQLVDTLFERYHFKTFEKRRSSILKTLNIEDRRK